MSAALPNLLIIGAAKCATTTLHAHLAQHPEVFMSEQKELNFFTRPDWRDRVDWYRRQFQAWARVRGESSPAYTMHPVIAGVPERVHELVPDAKLLYIVRDPIDRLLAHYVELRSLHLEHRPLPEALADPDNAYLSTSRYATQVDRYLRRFPERQLLVVDQDDLRLSREATLRRVFDFLRVDPDVASRMPAIVLNPRRDKRRLKPAGDWLLRRGALRPVPALPGPLKRGIVRILSQTLQTPDLDAEARVILEHELRPEADRLRQRTGLAFAGWSV